MHVKVYEAQQVLVIHKWHNDHHALSILNFSKKEQSIEIFLTNHSWTLALNSADLKWNGPGAAVNEINSGTLSLSPESFTLFLNEHV